MYQFCSMEKHLTPTEAWEDFYSWMQERKKNKEFARIPADVQEANYAYMGGRKHSLGERRVGNLLAKYAPGRYVKSTYYIINE
jgi:hypothetical protein